MLDEGLGGQIQQTHLSDGASHEQERRRIQRSILANDVTLLKCVEYEAVTRDLVDNLKIDAPLHHKNDRLTNGFLLDYHGSLMERFFLHVELDLVEEVILVLHESILLQVINLSEHKLLKLLPPII